MATAEIVAIGSELLLGQIVDTNSAWMAQRLTALGVNLYFKSVVGDNPGRMKEVISRALKRADIVITSANHGLISGEKVTISGVLGNTAANGTFTITKVDNDRFSLNSTTGNGAYTSGGAWTACVGSFAIS